MKKIYLFFTLLVFAFSAQAQCEAALEITANVNVVTATIVATGAVAPFYTIDWGDGSGADFSQSATHTYANPGTYVITWVYADMTPGGCSLTATQEVIITGGGCTLDFTPIAVGLAVSVNATSSQTSAPVYTLDWGDGSPVVNSNQGFHQYAAAGTYTICVSVSDADNPDFCNLYQCQDVTVVESSGNCTVDLTVDVSGTTVNATAVGTGATLANYIISWGDNTISNSASASHVYSIAGDYEICVYYGDLTPNGCQVSDCQTITAEAGTGDCTLDITVNPVGLNVVVTANGFGAEAPEYSIDWGDGTSMDNGVPATHLYSAAGTYQVCVSYIDLNNIAGCQVNQCQEVTISEGTSDCTVDLVVTTDGLNVNATATGTGATNPTYAINWGDGTFPSLGATGTYTYAAEGTFDVCVTYLDLNNVAGCAVTDCQTIVVTGISENILSQNSIQVMPNPLADNSTLMISLNRNADIEINAYDLIGNKVDNIMNGSRGQGTHRISWNTENLASGIYFVKVKANNEEKTIKVIR